MLPLYRSVAMDLRGAALTTRSPYPNVDLLWRMVGAPGYDPGRLQQSAAPVYKTELHASAGADDGAL